MTRTRLGKWCDRCDLYFGDDKSRTIGKWCDLHFGDDKSSGGSGRTPVSAAPRDHAGRAPMSELRTRGARIRPPMSEPPMRDRARGGRAPMRLALLAFLGLVTLAAPARAHDLRPGILTFVEDGRYDLRMRFVPPIDSRGEAIDLALVLPDGCTRTGDRVHCKHGFTGTLAVGGMRGHAMKIFVSLERDGARQDWIVTSEAPRLVLPPLRSRWPRLVSIGVIVLVLYATRRLALDRSVGKRGVVGLRAHRAAAYALGALAAWQLIACLTGG